MMPKSIIVAIALGMLAASSVRAAEPLTLLTGDTSGVYFPLGIAIAKVLSDAQPDRTVQVQVTKGSVANLKLLAGGEGEIGFADAASMQAALRGDANGGFDRPLTNLRSLGALYPDYIQIVAMAKSGIRTLGDLKGKRLSIGAAQSGSALSARKILAAAGFDEKDIATVVETSFSDAITQMKEDKIDATLQSAGLGVASLNELSNTSDIVMIGIPRNVVDRVGPPFTMGTIPANTYRGQADAVPTAAIMNHLVIRADLSDDRVANLTGLIFDRIDEIRQAHRATSELTILKATQSGPFPTHPGAERYFRIKLQRVRADAFNASGEQNLAQGLRAAALADFAAALKLDPEHRAARDNQKALARTLEREGAMMGQKTTGPERRAK
jgi:TRAP transporter TAXI family solute receptor